MVPVNVIVALVIVGLFCILMPAGKIYLSPIIDCFDGLPVSWTIGTSPDAELVNTMLDNAIGTLKENDHPIIHSDRGAHYRWSGWIERMENAGRELLGYL